MERYRAAVPKGPLFLLIYYVEVRRFALVSDPAVPASAAGNAEMKTGIHNDHVKGHRGFDPRMNRSTRPSSTRWVGSRSTVSSETSPLVTDFHLTFFFFFCKKVSRLKEKKKGKISPELRKQQWKPDFKPTNPDMMTVKNSLIPALLQSLKGFKSKWQINKAWGSFFFPSGFLRKASATFQILRPICPSCFPECTRALCHLKRAKSLR